MCLESYKDHFRIVRGVKYAHGRYGAWYIVSKTGFSDSNKMPDGKVHTSQLHEWLKVNAVLGGAPVKKYGYVRVRVPEGADRTVFEKRVTRALRVAGVTRQL